MEEAKPKTIDMIYAYIAINEDDNGREGIVSAHFDGGHHFPLITGSVDLCMMMKSMAQQAAKESGKEIRLVRFITREDIGPVL